MKEMLEILFHKEMNQRPEGSGVKTSSKPKLSKSKRKGKEVMNTPVVTEVENNPLYSPEVSSGESGEVSSPDNSSRNKRMDDFQSQLDALKLKKDSAESGVAKPNPVEWDTVPYPPKFKPMSLIQFDEKGSLT